MNAMMIAGFSGNGGVTSGSIPGWIAAVLLLAAAASFFAAARLLRQAPSQR